MTGVRTKLIHGRERIEGHRSDVAAQIPKGGYPKLGSGGVSSSWVFKNQEDSQLSDVVTVTSQSLSWAQQFQEKNQPSLDTDVFQGLLGDAW